MKWCTFVYIQSTWENWMQLCRNLKVFSSTEQPCTPSLRHTPGTTVFNTLRGLNAGSVQKNPNNWTQILHINKFFFFCQVEQVEKKPEKRIISQHSLSFFIFPYCFWLHTTHSLTSFLICLLYGVFILYKDAGSQSVLRADSIDWNCLDNGKFQQWAILEVIFLVVFLLYASRCLIFGFCSISGTLSLEH